MIERPKFQDWWDGRGEDASYGFLGCLSACEPIIAGLEAKVEQMHVQMAGILTAAFGWSIGQDNCAKKGDWGWSVTYQDVLELRLKTDARIAELEKQLGVKDAEIAGAFIAAAGHQPMIAIDPTASKVWVYCSCGFNKESVSYETDPEIWTAHILKERCDGNLWPREPGRERRPMANETIWIIEIRDNESQGWYMDISRSLSLTELDALRYAQNFYGGSESEYRI